jgi:polyisoprenoid-binding protein YceI
MRYALLSCLLFGIASPVSATEWTSTSGEFSFVTVIEGVDVPGHFNQFVVTFNNEPGKPEKSKLRVTVDLRAADMGDAEMNATLFDPAWFDVEQFTEAVFESANLTYSASGEFIASGTLMLKGASRPVAVPFTWKDHGDTASMQGRFTLQRTRFDVGSGDWADDDYIGIDVNLSFAIEFERAP